MTKVTHPKCGKSWNQRGNRTGHCAKCHETFEGISLFDWHQVLNPDGSVLCRKPSDAKWIEKGLRLVDNAWRGKELPPGVFGKLETPPQPSL